MTITPARPRSTLCTIAPRFWVPASTCTKTACGRPVMFQYACAAASETLSKVEGSTVGAGSPASASEYTASCTGAVSVPGLRNRYSTPCAASSDTRCSAVVFSFTWPPGECGPRRSLTSVNPHDPSRTPSTPTRPVPDPKSGLLA